MPQIGKGLVLSQFLDILRKTLNQKERALYKSYPLQIGGEQPIMDRNY